MYLYLLAIYQKLLILNPFNPEKHSDFQFRKRIDLDFTQSEEIDWPLEFKTIEQLR